MIHPSVTLFSYSSSISSQTHTHLVQFCNWAFSSFPLPSPPPSAKGKAGAIENTMRNTRFGACRRLYTGEQCHRRQLGYLWHNSVCVCAVLSPFCLRYFLQQYWNTLIFLQFGSCFIKCLFIFFAFGMELKLARPFSCLNKRNFSVNNISSHKCVFVLPLMSEQNEGWCLWGKQDQTKSLS